MSILQRLCWERIQHTDCQINSLGKYRCQVRQPAKHAFDLTGFKASRHALQAILPIALEPAAPPFALPRFVHVAQMAPHFKRKKTPNFYTPMLEKLRNPFPEGVCSKVSKHGRVVLDKAFAPTGEFLVYPLNSLEERITQMLSHGGIEPSPSQKAIPGCLKVIDIAVCIKKRK